MACAQVVPLSGGERDIEPPKEVESFPKNGSTNFNSDEIEIEFNEYIQTQNLSSQLIVSPFMETPPEISVKNKKLIIKLKDTLTPNTTYSLNFGEAIRDITESNPIPNYKYVFSTGDFIDSLTYAGTIVNAEDLTPKEKIYVLLYNQFEDSVPLKVKPRYIAISDKDGKFNITNIAAGTYKLFAINDINGNYLFDLPNEEIAFSDSLIIIDKNSSENILKLFEEKNNIQFVVKSEHKNYGEFAIILNSPSDSITINPLNNNIPTDWAIIDINPTNDTIHFWLKPTVSLEELEIELSNDGGVIDTLSFSVIDKKKFKDTTLLIKANTSASFDLNRKVVFQLNRPYSNFYSDNIVILKDSIDISSQISFKENSQLTVELDYQFEENTNYQIIILPNTFNDIYEIKNDTLNYQFKTKKISDYGTIDLTIEPNFSEKYILLLTKNNQVTKETFLQGKNKVSYEYLSPGNYGLKIIIDNNNDKEWTSGNYLKKLQPEDVIYYDKTITIKANWDNDINWIIKD